MRPSVCNVAAARSFFIPASPKQLARVEALARRLDELRPGAYDAIQSAYQVRTWDMLSACELSGLADILLEDIAQMEGAQ